MTDSALDTLEQSLADDDDDDFVHIVGWLEDIRSRATGRAPYALCGEFLGSDVIVDTDPNSPQCPECVAAERSGKLAR